MKKEREILRKQLLKGGSIIIVSFLLCASLMAKHENLALMDKEPEQKMLQQATGENYDNLSAERIDTGWGYLDKNGNVAIPGYFEDAKDFTFGIGAVKFGGKWGFIDKDLEVIAYPSYDDCKAFSENLAPVCKGNKWGYIDRNGNKKIDFKFVLAGRFHEGLAAVTETGLENSFGFIDSEGIYKIKPGEFDFARKFTEGLAAVKNEGKWGYIDHNGKLVIPYKYNDALYFSQGLAPILIDGKWGYIDKKGKEVIPPAYEYAGLFTLKGALVYQGGKSFIIDKKGNHIKTTKDSNHNLPNIVVNSFHFHEASNYHTTCLTLVNLTSLTIFPNDSFGLKPNCTVEMFVTDEIPTKIKADVTINGKDEKGDKEVLCNVSLYPWSGSEPIIFLEANLINQFKGHGYAMDKRRFTSRTVYDGNSFLVMDVDSHVWVLVESRWETANNHIYQPTLFLIDKSKFPDWEYLVGIK